MREKGGRREQLPQHSPGSLGYLSLTDSPCIQPLLGSHPTQEGTHFSARWWRLGVHTLLPPLTFHPYPLRTLASQIIYCPRTFVPAMPSGDSLAQCKSMSSERLFLLTLFSLPWNYPDGMGHKAQEDKNLIYPGPGGSPAPCTGPT